jgi:hypothetical protein
MRIRQLCLPLGVVVGLLLLLPIVRAGMRLSVDFGEGWHAYVSDAVARGEPLYPGPGSLTPVNYPPLWFYLLAAGRRLAAWSPLWLGRLLASLALAVVAVEVWGASRLCGASRAAAWFGALLFVGLVAAAAPRYIGMNDPQWLAHSLMEGALLLVLKALDGGDYRLWPAAVLMTVALFVKHNLLALPLAVSLTLFAEGRARGWRWCGMLGATGATALVLVRFLTGPWFLDNLLLGRRYGPHWLWPTAAIAWVAMLVPLGLVASCLGPLRANAAGRLVLAYLGCALAVGTLAAGGSGTDVNMFFSGFVAVAVAAARGLTLLEARPARCQVAAMAMIGWLACAVPLRALTPARYRALVRRQLDTAADVAFLRTQPGPAYCEQMLLCYWAGKPLVLQPYFVPEQIATGVLSEQAIAALFAARRFAVLQLDRPIGPAPLWTEPQRLPAGVLTSIARRYRLARLSMNGAFYLPDDVPRPGP